MHGVLVLIYSYSPVCNIKRNDTAIFIPFFFLVTLFIIPSSFFLSLGPEVSLMSETQ